MPIFLICMISKSSFREEGGGGGREEGGLKLSADWHIIQA